jgi:hypothetical protein
MITFYIRQLRKTLCDAEFVTKNALWGQWQPIGWSLIDIAEAYHLYVSMHSNVPVDIGRVLYVVYR